MKRYNNNARKRQHVPKVSRHWKPIVTLKATDEELREAFKSPDSFNRLVSRMTQDVYSAMEYLTDRYFNDY